MPTEEAMALLRNALVKQVEQQQTIAQLKDRLGKVEATVLLLRGAVPSP